MILHSNGNLRYLCQNNAEYDNSSAMHNRQKGGRSYSITYREFARRGTHLYAHNFVPPPGFLFVWRGIEKNNQKRLNS